MRGRRFRSRPAIRIDAQSREPTRPVLFFTAACNLLLINRANMLEGRTKRKRACPAVDNICVSTPRPVQANTLISSAIGE
jgi:hypothetical protein